MTKILIIDPDKDLLRDTQNFLESLGYNVITSTNGATGVQKALQYKPELILSDTKPSGLSGQEVFNMVKQVNTTSLIPFVFLTNKKTYEELRAVMNLGVDDFLVKPFDYIDLKRLIEIRLQKQRKLIEKTSEKFTYLVDNANIPICIYKEESFEYVNHKACEIFNYSKEELIGMSLINLVYKDDIQYVIDKINSCFKGIKDEVNIDFRAIKRNREIVYLKFSARLVEIESANYLAGTVYNVENVAITGKSSIQRKGVPNLTPREKDILDCICQGKSNQEIAEKLNISVRTVEGHRNRLLKKSGCKNSVCLAIYAIKHNLYKI